MVVSPLAGKQARPDQLIDVNSLVGQYYEVHPDPSDPAQRVRQGAGGVSDVTYASRASVFAEPGCRSACHARASG